MYYHRNLLNNKLYIGISKDINKRWSAFGNRYNKCKVFYRAIQKYGWDNFEHTVLIDDISKEKAYEIEKYLIKKYNTTNKQYGYNIALGGSGGCTVKGNRHFLSKKVYQYDLDGNFIQEWENAQRASETLKICVSDIHTNCRQNSGVRKAGTYMWRYEKFDKIDRYVRESINKKPILQINKDFTIVNRYKTVSHIDGKTFSHEKIINCCTMKSKTHKNFYWVYEEDFINMDSFKNRIASITKSFVDKRAIPVNQYSKDGILIKQYISARQASIETGIKRGTIQSYCKRGTSSTSEFIWEYVS